MKLLIFLGITSIFVLFVVWTMLVTAKRADDIIEEYNHKN